MSNFYNYDTRGASAASQIINLERMVEERDAEIERLRKDFTDLLRIAANDATAFQAEIERLRALLREAPDSGIWRDGEWISPAPEWYQRAREASGDKNS
jgi:hypothetical protein